MLHYSPLLEIRDLESNQPPIHHSLLPSLPLILFPTRLRELRYLQSASRLPPPTLSLRKATKNLQTHPALRALLSKLLILIPTDGPRFLFLLY